MRANLVPASLFWAVFLCSLMFLTYPVFAGDISRTPSDVYHLTESLAEYTRSLRRFYDVTIPWPEPRQQNNKAPRHVLQKALEILKKINRLRQIKGVGSISIPLYPSRRITPNEVFDMVERLNAEAVLLLPLEEREITNEPKIQILNKTPNDVYQALWQVSLALDPLLGVRGFTPKDVYAQTEQILEMVRFLRLTQNLSNNIKQPSRPTGKHPNHALQAANELLTRIAKAEENLWIEPAQVPKLERRVITPTEVYDALANVIAELQRIKYRLGVERHFPELGVKREKTPDDVVQNLRWAAAMMPLFPLGAPLYQQNPTSLTKTPADVYQITQHILDELSRYRALRGIHTIPRQPSQVSGLQPKHVYQKTLEGLEKINILRKQVQMKVIALPQYPLRKITPTEVFDLAIRLNMELQQIYERAKLKDATFIEFINNRSAPNSKTPSDVYSNMWRISYLLDTVIGTEGYTPNDVYRETMIASSEIKLIAQHLNRWKTPKTPDFIDGYGPGDVIIKARGVLQLVARIQDRAGIFEKRSPLPQSDGEVTPSDVFNMVGLIRTELIALKLHFGITEQPRLVTDIQDKSPSHVYQLLTQAHASLSHLLNDEPQASEEVGE